MQLRTLTTTSTLLLALFVATSALGQPDPEPLEVRRKLAQTGMQFLSVSVDARAAALGDAYTAQGGTSASMFYNPSGMADMTGFTDISLGQLQWLADTEYNYGSIAFRPADGVYGTFGVSVIAVRYGNFIGTRRAENEKGFIDTDSYSPSALSAGVGYARALTDKFSVGANVKYVRQSLGASTVGLDDSGGLVQEEFSKGALAVDFGTTYHTGYRSLTFAVSARNFSRELTYVEEGFELPLSFQVGASMDVMDFTQLNRDTHSLLLSLDAAHPRSFVEQVKIGGEYTFLNTFAVRAGYIYPHDVQGLNVGAGVQTDFGGSQLGFDYSYSQLDIFDNAHRFTLRFGL